MANGRTHHKFSGTQRDCGPCDLRHRCLRYPERTPVRQVAFFHKNQASPLVFIERMKQAIDSPLGRKLYGQRMAVVEPVLGNLIAGKINQRRSVNEILANYEWLLFTIFARFVLIIMSGYIEA